MKLELQDRSQKVPCIGDLGWHVILGRRIKICLTALYRRSYALIFLFQLPPRLVVILRLDLAGKDAPAPLINEQSEGQKRDFFQRLVHEQTQIAFRPGYLRDHIDLLEVLGCDGKGDGVADRLVEAVIRAVLEQDRLLTVSTLVHVVPQFMVDSPEILIPNADAHLEPKVFLVVDVPGAGVADYVAICRLLEERALPERLGQRIESQRREEGLTVADHPQLIDMVLLQGGSKVHPTAPSGDVEQVVDIGPVLRPDVAQQMSGQRAVERNQLGTVFLH